MKNLRLKTISTADLNVVLKQLKIAAEEIAKKGINQWDYWKNPSAERINEIRKSIEDKTFYFIQNKRNESIGMVQVLAEDLTYWGFQPDHAKYIHTLVVFKEFQGQQYGRKILRFLEEKYNQKADYLRLDCLASNSKLIHYYKQSGFKKVGKTKVNTIDYQLFEKKIA